MQNLINDELFQTKTMNSCFSWKMVQIRREKQRKKITMLNYHDDHFNDEFALTFVLCKRKNNSGLGTANLQPKLDRGL